LLVHGRWFSPGTPASSTTKTGRHDIVEILLKVALKHQKSNQPIRLRFAPSFVNYKKGALDPKPQVIKFTSFLPMVGGFSPGTPASSIIKTGRHDIAEILLKVALSTINQIKSNLSL
jgi:hypothetical protein